MTTNPESDKNILLFEEIDLYLKTRGASYDTQEQSDQGEFVWAREILGPNYLGVAAIRRLEKLLHEKGWDIKFNVDPLPQLPFNQTTIEQAGREGFGLSLEVPTFTLGDGKEYQTTMHHLEILFAQDPLGKSPYKPLITFELPQNRLIQDALQRTNEIKLRWALFKKEVLPKSLNLTKTDQDILLRRMGDAYSRRSGTQALWHLLLYYVTTGEMPLRGYVDLVSTEVGGRRFNGPSVLFQVVGPQRETDFGITVKEFWPNHKLPNLGVCPVIH